MNAYVKNRNCQCVRCRTHDLMGAAIIITLGVLLLLRNYHVVPFGSSWPALFLVVGAMLLISRTGSTAGHIDPPVYTGAGMAPPPPPQQWSTGITAPPAPSTNPLDPQVKP